MIYVYMIIYLYITGLWMSMVEYTHTVMVNDSSELLQEKPETSHRVTPLSMTIKLR